MELVPAPKPLLHYDGPGRLALLVYLVLALAVLLVKHSPVRAHPELPLGNRQNEHRWHGLDQSIMSSYPRLIVFEDQHIFFIINVDVCSLKELDTDDGEDEEEEDGDEDNVVDGLHSHDNTLDHVLQALGSVDSSGEES